MTAKPPTHGPPTTRQSLISLKCTERILAIEPQTHDPTKVELAIQKFTMDGVELVDAATSIVVENTGDKTLYLVNGNALEDKTAGALSYVIAVRSPRDTTSYDDAFGSKQPQKVGDSWSLDPAMGVKMFHSPRRPTEPENLSGNGKLVAIESSDHDERMEVELNINVAKIRGEWGKGWRIADGNLTSKISEIVPLEERSKAGEFRQEDIESLDLVYKVAEGRTAEYTCKIQLIRTANRTLVPN